MISIFIFSISETMSEAVKLLKGEYVITALEEHKMDKALIFCRTKLDCDNLEKYLQERGQGMGHNTAGGGGGGLIFCRTKLDCDNLEKYLQERGQGMGALYWGRYSHGYRG